MDIEDRGPKKVFRLLFQMSVNLLGWQCLEKHRSYLCISLQTLFMHFNPSLRALVCGKTEKHLNFCSSQEQVALFRFSMISQSMSWFFDIFFRHSCDAWLLTSLNIQVDSFPMRTTSDLTFEFVNAVG